MSRVKLAIISGVSGLVIFMVLVIALVEPLRTGVIDTIRGTAEDTVAVIVDNETGGKSPTDEADLSTPEGGEPTDELGKDTASTGNPEDAQDAEKMFREDDRLKILIPDTVGNAVIVRDGSDTMLVDTGVAADFARIDATLQANDVTKLKYLIISNWHPETIGGAVQVLTKYPADYIIVSGNVLENENGVPLITYLTKNNLLWTTPSNSGSMYLGSVSFKALSSHKSGSLLTFINYGTTNISISGTTQYFEDGIFKYLPKNLDLHIATLSKAGYKVPDGMINKLSPQNVILNNIKGFDDSTTVNALTETGAQLMKTSEAGNIAIGSNGEDLNIILNAK